MHHQHVGYTADGREITAVGGVVYDDEYIAAEEAHAQAQRAAIIEQYGSMLAYDTWALAETRRMRQERREIMARMRIERARARRPRALARARVHHSPPARTSARGEPADVEFVDHELGRSG